jgi:hypothetical protein
MSLRVDVSCPTNAVDVTIVSGGDDYSCEISSIGTSMSTATCTLKPGRRQKRRLVSGSTVLQESRALEVVTSSTIVINGFQETILTAQDLTVGDLAQAWIVIILYSVLWGIGLSSMAICGYRQSKYKSQADLVKVGVLTQGVKKSIKEYLTHYIDETFPPVFHFNTFSKYQNMYEEVTRHHRYLLILTSKGKTAEHTRIVTGIQLMTIQSMYLFMLAVVYDLQVHTISYNY